MVDRDYVVAQLNRHLPVSACVEGARILAWGAGRGAPEDVSIGDYFADLPADEVQALIGASHPPEPETVSLEQVSEIGRAHV